MLLPAVIDFIASTLVGNGAAAAEPRPPTVKAPANAQTTAVLTIFMAVLPHEFPRIGTINQQRLGSISNSSNFEIAPQRVTAGGEPWGRSTRSPWPT
jgi:hypothetical protein